MIIQYIINTQFIPYKNIYRLRASIRNTTLQKALKNDVSCRITRFINSLSKEHFSLLDSGAMSIKCTQLILKTPSSQLIYRTLSKRFLASVSLELDQKLTPILELGHKISIEYLRIYLKLILIPGIKNNKLSVSSLRNEHMLCFKLNPSILQRIQTPEDLDKIKCRQIILKHFVLNSLAPGIGIFYTLVGITSSDKCKCNAHIISELTCTLPNIHNNGRFFLGLLTVSRLALALCVEIGLIELKSTAALTPYLMLSMLIIEFSYNTIELLYNLKNKNQKNE